VLTIQSELVSLFEVFFEGTPRSFMREVVTRLQARVYLDGRPVVHFKEKVKEIFLIYRGWVEVFDKGSAWLILHYSEGSYFGDFSYFFKTKSDFTYHTPDGCETILYSLPQSALAKIFGEYTWVKNELKLKALRR